MAKETKNKKEKKHYFKDFKAELRKVIWPTPKQLLNNTVAVITIVLITAVIVFALDFVFEKMNTYGINKLKEAVTSSNEIENTLSNTDAVTSEEEKSNSEEEVTSEEEEETSTEEEESEESEENE